MTLATCPKCDEQVTIPAGADREANVRCPLCQEEYVLGDVLDQLPPMLVLLDAPVAVGSSATEPESVGEGFVADEVPAFAFGQAAEQTDGASDEAVETEAFGEGVFGTDEAEAGADGALPAFGEPAESDGPAPFDFAGAPTEDDDDASPKRRSRPAPRKKKSSPIKELIKIVLGGLVALPATQLILWWLPGTWARDPLSLAPKLPAYVSFLAPEKMRNPGSADSDDPFKGGSMLAGANEEDNEPFDSGLGSQLGTGADTPGTGGDIPGTGGDIPGTGGDIPGTGGDIPGTGGDIPGTGGDVPGTRGDEPGMGGDEPGTGGDGGDSLENLMPDTGDIDPFTPFDPTVVDPDPIDPDDDPDDGSDDPLVADDADGVVDAPKVPADEVATVAATATQAATAWKDAQGAERGVKLEAAKAFYEAFCQLGRASAFAERADAASPAADETVAALLSEVGQAKINAALVARFAGQQLGATNAPGNGICLSGTVKEIRPAGQMFEMLLEIPGKTPQTVSVITPFDPADNVRSTCAVGDSVLLLGAVVPDPTLNLIGYDGEEDMVIWGGQTAVLPKTE